jgi:hypothetical protein
MPHSTQVSSRGASGLEQELMAGRRRLDGPKQKLAWFLEFKDMDLNKLTPSEIAIQGFNLLSTLDLLDNLQSVTAWKKQAQVHAYGPLDILKKKEMGALDLKTLRAIQTGIRDALASLFSPGMWTTEGPDLIGFVRESGIDARQTKLRHQSWTVKTEQAVLGIGFARALDEAGEYLRWCKREACRKPFVANTRRQEYCSMNCSQIVRNETKKKKREEKKPKQK